MLSKLYCNHLPVQILQMLFIYRLKRGTYIVQQLCEAWIFEDSAFLFTDFFKVMKSTQAKFNASNPRIAKLIKTGMNKSFGKLLQKTDKGAHILCKTNEQFLDILEKYEVDSINLVSDDILDVQYKKLNAKEWPNPYGNMALGAYQLCYAKSYMFEKIEELESKSRF